MYLNQSLLKSQTSLVGFRHRWQMTAVSSVCFWILAQMKSIWFTIQFEIRTLISSGVYLNHMTEFLFSTSTFRIFWFCMLRYLLILYPTCQTSRRFSIQHFFLCIYTFCVEVNEKPIFVILFCSTRIRRLVTKKIIFLMCSLTSIIILGNNGGAIQESIIESYCFCYNKLVWIKTIIINTMWICRNPTKISLSSPKKSSYLKNQIPKISNSP